MPKFTCSIKNNYMCVCVYVQVHLNKLELVIQLKLWNLFIK